MKLRGAALVLLAIGLIATVGIARARLEQRDPDRLAAGLLYLPQGPYLRALAVGQEETLADLLYIWAIQYYSSYDDLSRYDFLEQVFHGAITELDPRFDEAYLVGALIMSIEARDPAMALRLYDKGLELIPDNWELAYWAGWECYFTGDYRAARRYWQQGAERPGAPPELGRHAARMLERVGDLSAAREEYWSMAETAEDEATRVLALAWLERLDTELALRAFEQAIESYRRQHGHCPESLIALEREGLVELPRHESGAALFRFDADNCRALPAPGRSIEGAR
ncbi:MAG: hypothetical protein JSV80_13355 [Acidobacteriota bacterium]|nr:MAG: hypothetical protein JSV80_13355 [Acidobacteriota bacterium]